MSIHTLFRSLTSTPTRRRPIRRRPPASRLCLESLEDRCLLSFSPAVSYPVGVEPAGGGDGRLQRRRPARPRGRQRRQQHRERAAGQRRRHVPAGPELPPPAPARSLVAVGDFNGDGKLDLVTANAGADDVSVLLGNGNGTFQAPTNIGIGSNPQSVAVGDFNGDGKLDLAVADAPIPGLRRGLSSKATCCSATATARSGRRFRTSPSAARTSTPPP